MLLPSCCFLLMTVSLSWEWFLLTIRVVGKILSSGARQEERWAGSSSASLALACSPGKYLPFQSLGAGAAQCHQAMGCWLNGIASVLFSGLSSVCPELSGSSLGCHEEMIGFRTWRDRSLAICILHLFSSEHSAYRKCTRTKTVSGVPRLGHPSRMKLPKTPTM